MELTREEMLERLGGVGYVADAELLMAIVLMQRLECLLLVEGEPEAEAERLSGCDALVNRLRLFADGGENLIPSFARMDVEAIGQMQAGFFLNKHV